MGYKTYSEYKNSGVTGLDRVPNHWTTWKATHGFAKIGSGTTPKSDNANYYGGDIAWVTTSELREKPIFETQVKLTKQALQDYPTLKTYSPHSLIIAMYGATIGRLGILEIEATVNQACCVFSDPEQFDTKFFYYWLWMWRPTLLALSAGGGQPNLSQDTLKQIRAPAPSITEQQKISNFLDHKTAQIDRLIEKNQELIEKLQEQRITVITQAVTKGLDSRAALKDSGIEWLGEIPAHWEVATVRRFIAKIEQGWSPSCEDRPASPDEWAVLKSGCVNGGFFQESEHKTLPQDLDPPLGLEVRAGNILMCRASGSKHLIGSVAKVKECRKKLIFSDKTYRVTVDRNSLNPEFFTIAMRSKYMREQIELSISGAEGLANNIPQSLVKSYVFAAPPLEEQNHIVERLELFSQKTEQQEQSINEAIERLQEYRTALITAAVTGQIDVRDWQAPASVEASEQDKEVA